MYFSILARRSTEHNLLTSCNLCRNSQHQYSGKEWSRSTGDIQPHFLYGNSFLPTSNSRLSLYPFAFKALRRMECLYILLCQPDGLFQFLAYQRFRFFLLFFRYGQCAQRYFVKLFFIPQHCTITFRFYTVYNTPYRIEEVLRIHNRTF